MGIYDLQEADVNGDGMIDYEEFLAATINRSKLEREELLKQVGSYKGPCMCCDVNH